MYLSSQSELISFISFIIDKLKIDVPYFEDSPFIPRWRTHCTRKVDIYTTTYSIDGIEYHITYDNKRHYLNTLELIHSQDGKVKKVALIDIRFKGNSENEAYETVKSKILDFHNQVIEK